jgi:hypothetical protein
MVKDGGREGWWERIMIHGRKIGEWDFGSVVVEEDVGFLLRVGGTKYDQ